MSLRAYHDPALTRLITRNGSWLAPLELVVGRDSQRSKSVYVLNDGRGAVAVKLTASAPGFSVVLPPSVNLAPGVTRIPVTLQAGAFPAPTAIDFTIIGEAANEYGQSPHSDDAYSDLDSTLDSGALVGVVLKIEATAHALPTSDERFGDYAPSPLRSVTDYTEYIASGMGFVDDDYRNTIVNLMAEHVYDPSVWALNKHLLFDARYGPMRLARERADSIGYNPPGVPALPPIIRRRVYARAFELARKTGSAEGIKAIFNAIGIPLTEMLVWREGFTWFVRVPQWVAAAYDIDFLGIIALYHVDPYCIIDIATHEGTIDGEYTDLDYTVEPGGQIAGGNLLLEDGVLYLLLENGTKIELEGINPDPDYTVTYNDEAVTYNGDPITYTPD